MTTIPPTRHRPIVAALAAVTLLAAACHARTGAAKSLSDISRVPHTTAGALLFSPPRDATEVDPSQPVVVQTRFSDAHLQGVTLTDEGGPYVAGSLTAARFVAERALHPDASYTVTAVVAVPAPAGTPGAETTQTEVVAFATARTPKVVAVSPTVVAPGKPTTLTFDRPAREVKVDGPVTFQISAEGTSVALYPVGYRQGATFAVSVTATSMKGTVGRPQPASFMAEGGPTVSVSPGGGSSNMGVAIPLTVTLGQPPLDPTGFAGRFQVTAEVSPTLAPPVTPTLAPPVTPSVTPTVSPVPLDPGAVSATFVANPCFQYAPTPAGAALVVATTWVTPTRLQLTPKTPDGYWPPHATIGLSAQIEGLSAQDGSWFPENLQQTFKTGDKRVIDVDLASQTLSACRNGALDRQFPVSTGTHGRETPAGHFAIYSRIKDAEMKSSESEFAPDYYDVKHVPWTQYFHNGDALHGAWWHNNFGHPMSHGCVNISTQARNRSWPDAAPNAEYLWNFDNLGDPVIVHGSTP